MDWPYDFRLMQGPYPTQQRNFEESLCSPAESEEPDMEGHVT